MKKGVLSAREKRDPSPRKRSWPYFVLLPLIGWWGWRILVHNDNLLRSYLSIDSLSDSLSDSRSDSFSNVSTTPQQTAIKERNFDVGPVLPSAATVQTLLESERQKIIEAGGIAPYPNYELLANTYALTYAFIREFEIRHIPIFLYAGSVLGAMRHHGIIPFSEKDVDFAVFSTNSVLIGEAIQAAFNSQGGDIAKTGTFEKVNFGYQFEQLRHADPALQSKPLVSHYSDFWFFESYADGAGTKKAKCVGRDNKTGCRDWFKTFWAKNPPVYDYSDWFPPRYQVFGTHRVPISSTNKHIETWVFDEGKDFWNTTCGPWRRWYDKGGWIITPKNERVCSNFYDKNPFVFLTGNGTEQLRQNSTVLHESQRSLHKK